MKNGIPSLKADASAMRRYQPRLKSAAEIAFFAPPQKKLSNVKASWYEASRWSPNRMWVWQPVQDARRDLDRYTRFELNKRAEYLWKNSPFIRGLIERLVTLTIGTGIFPTAKSSDPKWNAAAKKYWRKICRRPCVDGNISMNQYVRNKARGRFKHGESFTLLTHSDRFDCDAIQGLEWHRITGANRSAPGVDNYTGVQGRDSTFGDGIDHDEQGFPTWYHIEGFNPVTKSPLDPVAEQFMVHHFTPCRDEQLRGETILSSAINTAQDVKEILDFEKQAVKDASTKQDIIQTLTGDFDPEQFNKLPFNVPGMGAPTPAPIPEDFENKIQYYKVQFQGGPVLLKTGDKYTPYVPNRPGSAWEGFMAFLANTIVLGTGLPPSLVIPIDIGGTDIRRDLQIGQKVVEAWQDDIGCEFQRIWEYFMMGAVEDRLLPSPPEDWREVEWHFTGSLTVDRNKDQVRKALVEAGLMSWDEYFGESGWDGDEQEAKVVAEVLRRRQRITGIAITEPFESAAEFKQFLSLSETSAITFRETSPSPQDDAGAGGQNIPGQKKVKRQNQPQPQNA
jgi:capsid protein